jgi:hypothetical protein
MRRRQVTPWRRDSTEMASGNPGAVQGSYLHLIFARRNNRTFNWLTFEQNAFAPIAKTPRGSHNPTDL